VGLLQSEILSELSEGLASVADLDKEKAAALVAAKLQPFLEKNGITADKCHYTSPYYDAK